MHIEDSFSHFKQDELHYLQTFSIKYEFSYLVFKEKKIDNLLKIMIFLI